VCVCVFQQFIHPDVTTLITVICQLLLLRQNIFCYSRLSSPSRVSIGLNSKHNITASILSLLLHLTGTVLLKSKEVVRSVLEEMRQIIKII
jgi:hypothetical protein